MRWESAGPRYRSDPMSPADTKTRQKWPWEDLLQLPASVSHRPSRCFLFTFLPPPPPPAPPPPCVVWFTRPGVWRVYVTCVCVFWLYETGFVVKPSVLISGVVALTWLIIQLWFWSSVLLYFSPDLFPYSLFFSAALVQCSAVIWRWMDPIFVVFLPCFVH